MRRYHITVGAKTTANGSVTTGWPRGCINGQAIAREGDEVLCPTCKSIGLIVCDGMRLVETLDGREAALDGDLCRCQCDPLPRLIASQTIRSQIIGEDVTRINIAALPTISARQIPHGSRVNHLAPRPAAALVNPTSTCENLWRTYQARAEAIVAPAGRLISDPKARNRAINAAYAQLWRLDNRFQWAGLAAFASKQVGCGLLHAAESIDKIQAEYTAGQQMLNSAKRRWKLPWLTLFGGHDKQAQRDYEQARRNNPVPSVDLRYDGESMSAVQQLYLHVYDMLALGNTTLFLDVYPLHVFYLERGLGELESCLGSRQNIFRNREGQQAVLWPVEQAKLRFGTDHKEILRAFRAIEAGNIAEGVVQLAWHEQRNILQLALYSDQKLVRLLRSNHLSYVTGIPSGVAQAIELTLASQCSPLNDGRTVGFGRNPAANLADIDQRMAFVLSAAARFDELLRSADRHKIEKEIEVIAIGWSRR